MQEVRTYWVDGTSTLVARIDNAPQQMVFFHDNVQVATIDSDGNLNIKGDLIELNSPRELTLVHANDARWMIWPNPDIFYNGTRMSGILNPDSNSGLRCSYPSCFWNERDFYVWGKLETNVAGPAGAMLQFSQFELEGFGLYTKTSIRGVLKSEANKEQDEPDRDYGQAAI